MRNINIRWIVPAAFCGILAVAAPAAAQSARIGLIGSDGQIKEVWNSGSPVKPDPYLKGYEWAKSLS